jgi:hypothetical protein
MDDMPKHSRPAGWIRLRRSLIIGAVILAPVFFAVMFVSVTDFVRPSFQGLAWSVPVATEGCFALLYGLDLLLLWAGKPMGWLRITPYPFAAISLWLNVASANGYVPGMVGHGAVTAAFFLPVIAFEAAVRRLAVTDTDTAMADARTYAVDLCRSERGIFWRYRVPSLLRRQILSGRLPDEVRSDVSLKVSVGRTSGWESVVREWVMRELHITEQAQAASRKAVRDIARTEAETTLPAAVEPPSPAAAEPASDTPAETQPETGPKPLPRLTAKRSRTMTPDALAPWVSALLDDDPAVSLNRVIAELHVGRDKASEALRLAKRNRTVVAIGASR